MVMSAADDERLQEAVSPLCINNNNGNNKTEKHVKS